jgi:AcrR family transcriptional regulator
MTRLRRTERQERDRHAVQRAILDAARDLFVRDGYERVSIRKIAERIDYSPAAIYGYFPSKDDIFFELAEEGFRLLAGSETTEFEALSQLAPLERIRTLFWRLYEFSREHPQYFALMFVDRSVPRITREYERFAFIRELKKQVMAQIQACIDARVFPPTVDPLSAFHVLTTGLLGVSAMKLSDRLTASECADDLAHDVLELLIAGLQSGFVLRAQCASDTAAASSGAEEIR